MERANSFIGAASKSVSGGEKAIAVVDPFSTGAHVAATIVEKGFKCVRVLSIWDSPVASLIQEGVSAEYCATIQHDDQVPDQNQAINEVLFTLSFVTMVLNFNITLFFTTDCESTSCTATEHHRRDSRCRDRCGASGQSVVKNEGSI